MTTMHEETMKKRVIPEIAREVLRLKMLADYGIDIDAWIILLNKGKDEAGEAVMPADLVRALREIEGPIARMAIDARDLPKFQMTHQQRSHWNQGIAVLVKIGAFAYVEPQKAGGQRSTEIEKAVKRVLGVTVFLAEEYISELLRRLRPGTKYTKAELRDRARTKLLETWPEFITAAGAPAEATAEDIQSRRKKHLNTLWERGRRPSEWPGLFEAGTLPIEVFNADRRGRVDAMDKAGLAKELWFWEQCIRSLLLCEYAAKVRRQTVEEVSETVERRGEEYPGQREDLVHGLPRDHRPDIADILPAVFAGVEPSMAKELFLHLQASEGDYRIAQALGDCFRAGEHASATNRDEWLIARITLISSEQAHPDETHPDTVRREFLRHAIDQFWRLPGEKRTATETIG